MILSPTRELCMQIYNDLELYSKYQKNINIVAVYGGASIENQIRKIRSGVHIIVATPGRLLDLLKRKAANISGIRTIILDEADEMLNMGFREDLEKISSYAPKERQTLLFSATMPSEVAALSKVYLTDPIEITAGKANTGTLSVEHHNYVMQEKDRYSVLRRIVDYYPGLYALVFCRTRAECQHVAGLLMKDGYAADALHGDLSQAQRDYAMSRFRNKAIQILVATDVAARGIDVNNLTHVLNYNLPDDIDTYLHRSGRTGRANNKGISVVLVNVREKFKVKHLERKVNQKFIEMQIPNGKEICKKRIMHQIEEVVTLAPKEDEVDYMTPEYYEKFAELSKEEIIKRFLSLQFDEMFAKYQNVPNLNVSGGQSDRGDFRETRDRGGREDRDSQNQRYKKSGMTRMFINIGQIDGFDKEMMRDFLKDISENKTLDVAEVDIRDRFSIFTIPDQDIAPVKKSFTKIMFDNRPLRVDEMDRSDSKPTSGGRRSPREDNYSDRSSYRSSSRSGGGSSDRGGSRSYSSSKKTGSDRSGDSKRRSSRY